MGRRKIFELDEDVGPPFLEGNHHLVHEFVECVVVGAFAAGSEVDGVVDDGGGVAAQVQGEGERAVGVESGGGDVEREFTDRDAWRRGAWGRQRASERAKS